MSPFAPTVLRFLARWWPRSRPATPADDASFFATQYADQHDDTRLFVKWNHHAPDLRAQPYDDNMGLLLLIKQFGQDGALARLAPSQLTALGSCMEYVQVERGRQILGQDEQGDYMLIVLQGTVAQERLQPSGARVRLGEAQPGDLLGEMVVLDGGTRFCSCRALSPVTLAVLSSHSIERLNAEEPVLAAALNAWLARRLSLQLRQVTARLSAQLTKQAAH